MVENKWQETWELCSEEEDDIKDKFTAWVGATWGMQHKSLTQLTITPNLQLYVCHYLLVG